MNNMTLIFNVEEAIRRGGIRRVKYTFPTLISIYLQTAAKLIGFTASINIKNATDGKESGENTQD